MESFITRAEHEEFARRMDGEDKRQNKRLEMVERQLEQVQPIAVSVEKMACNMQAMLEEQKRQGDEQKSRAHALRPWNRNQEKSGKNSKPGLLRPLRPLLGLA